MQVLVGGDDRGRHLGPPQQLAEIGREEIGAEPLGHLLASIGQRLGDADPANAGMARGDLAADEPDASRPDDRESRSASATDPLPLASPS